MCSHRLPLVAHCSTRPAIEWLFLAGDCEIHSRRTLLGCDEAVG